MNRDNIQKDLKKLILKNLKILGIKPSDHLYLSVNMGSLFHDYVNEPDIIDLINNNKIFFTKYI